MVIGFMRALVKNHMIFCICGITCNVVNKIMVIEFMVSDVGQ